MKSLLKKYNNMKYRYKLTNLLVVVSLVPMTVLALYSHSRMSSLVRKNEMEDMYSILEQTRENIDGQIEIYASLLNYLTYSPEIQEVIFNKDMDRYTAYEQYTEVVDPLLTVPKSYHDAILGIHLFAESIPVRHEYTLAPLSEVDGEWWSDKLNNTVTVQWIFLHEEGEKKEDHSEYRPRNGNAREHRERLARELKEHDDCDGVEHCSCRADAFCEGEAPSRLLR